MDSSFKWRNTYWFSNITTNSRGRRRRPLMHGHNYFQKLSRRRSSSMNVDRCVPPISHCNLCVNHIGWICALNHQCHKTGWILSQSVFHQKIWHTPINKCWSWEEMKIGGWSIFTQQDDKSTQTKSDQVMKDISEPNFE